jgi:flagellar motor switch protein FliN/FliY
MTDEHGSLSQDEFNAALTEAGLDPAEDGAATDGAGEAAGVAANAQVDSCGQPFDEVAAAMGEAMEQGKIAAGTEVTPPPSGVPGAFPPGSMQFDIPELAVRQAGGNLVEGIELLRDVELDVKIELGRSRMLVDDVLRLGEGSVVELDKLAGDPVEVFVNDRLVARGEVLVLNDNFCVRINEIVRQESEEDN